MFINSKYMKTAEKYLKKYLRSLPSRRLVLVKFELMFFIFVKILDSLHKIQMYLFFFVLGWGLNPGPSPWEARAL